MRYAIRSLIALTLLLVASATFAAGGEGGWGIRGGLGTDIDLGLAVGLGGSYVLPLESQPFSLEFGADFLYSSTDETTTTRFRYDETTEMDIFGVRANMLFKYARSRPSWYYIAGVGAAAVSVDWEETSPDDSSLGTPYGNGGSMQSESGSAAGGVINLGVGRNFGRGFDTRLEMPMLVLFSDVGDAATFVPTVLVTATYRF